MVHQYKNNGYNIVLDVNSGAIHVVDDVSYDVIALYEDHTPEEIVAELSGTYSEAEVKEACEEVASLVKDGELFTKDEYENYIMDFKKRPTVVKALCLHIAHDCNLACRYCFAEEGEYHGHRELMSYEVGKKALDFLIANSGSRRNLEVDFFGGEPLMNWQVVKDLVKYGREQEKLHDKNFRFTLTTNGVLLNDEVMEFANKEMGNVVLSIDGRKEIHDHMRPFRNGKGSYDLIVPKFQQFAESRNQDKYYVRGTFTHYNLDFADDVLHLADLGFISPALFWKCSFSTSLRNPLTDVRSDKLQVLLSRTQAYSLSRTLPLSEAESRILSSAHHPPDQTVTSARSWNISAPD